MCSAAMVEGAAAPSLASFPAISLENEGSTFRRIRANIGIDLCLNVPNDKEIASIIRSLHKAA
jgi:hypothetical protein